MEKVKLFVYICSGVLSLSVIITLVYTFISKREFREYIPFLMRLINRFTLDRINRKNNRIFGFTLFCGQQGGGKTYSAVKYCVDMAREKKAVLCSNTPLKAPADVQYIYLSDITDIRYLPPADGYVILLDEIQTIFESKNTDNYFYSIFCQLRKRNIKLVGTAQVFDRVSLKLREQVHNLYYCRTFFGCLTRVKEYYPFINSGGKLSNKNSFAMGTKFIIQTDEVRQLYDTYYKI